MNIAVALIVIGIVVALLVHWSLGIILVLAGLCLLLIGAVR